VQFPAWSLAFLLKGTCSVQFGHSYGMPHLHPRRFVIPFPIDLLCFSSAGIDFERYMKCPLCGSWKDAECFVCDGVSAAPQEVMLPPSSVPDLTREKARGRLAIRVYRQACVAANVC
jgi:hypothetical protein